MQFKIFIFNPFQENTYVLFDETNTCAIIDAGNLLTEENKVLDNFIAENNFQVEYLLNTHNHLDHIFGAKHFVDKYNVKMASHSDDLFWINNFVEHSRNYGIQITEPAPKPDILLNDGDVITFGNTELQVIHLPGHSPGGVAFYNEKQGILFSGDSLFNSSIGRTDLPMGDYDSLISAIKEKLFVLPDDTQVFPGHGGQTTIGKEKMSNPFLS